MEQEVVKENMIKWMQELGKTIQTENLFREHGMITKNY